MGHYTIDADPDELGNAETKLAWLAEELGSGGQGGKLETLTGNTEGWTGQAATACLGEITRIGTAMTSQSAKFTTAHDAVHTFRAALQTAIDDDLAKLNKRWSDADDAYNTAVGKANSAYDTATTPPDPQASVPVSDADEQAASQARSSALGVAAMDRNGAQSAIDTDYATLVTGLQTAAQTCGNALAAAAAYSFTHDQWQQVKGGSVPEDMVKQFRTSALGAGSFVDQGDELEGGEGSEKPKWLEATETALKPLEATFLSIDATGFALFSKTAGGAFSEAFENGELWDLYGEDLLRGATGWEKGLTAYEQAGIGFGSAAKLLDGRALGPMLFADGSKAGSLVGKVGVLGPISVGVGVVSTVTDMAHGDWGAAALDGTGTALTVGALLAPPPADIVCGIGALGVAAYQNIPFVHDTVNAVGSAIADGAEAVGDAISDAASGAWDTISSWF